MRHKKAMILEQAEEWEEVLKEKIQSLIKHETLTLISKNNIAPRQRSFKGK